MLLRVLHTYFPANICLDEDVLKTSFVFRRRLDQDEYICLSNMSSRYLQDVQSRPIYSTWSYVFKTSCKNVFIKVLKRSSRHLHDVLQRYIQDVFKMYHQVKPFLLTRLRDIFNTFLRCASKTVIYRRICQGHTSEEFMVSVQNLQE